MRNLLGMWLLAIVAGCGGSDGGGPSGDPVPFIQAYCPWASYCDQITVTECARSGAASWGTNAEVLDALAACLEDATDCAAYAQCAAGVTLTECPSPDDPACGSSGCEGMGAMCTGGASMNVCVAGTIIPIDCTVAMVACVEQSVSGFFCE